jgi:predicted Zn-dependent protease
MSRAGKSFVLISGAWFALAGCGALGAATHGKSTGATPPARPSSTTRPAPQAPASKIDHTLDAMRDEMQRSRDRLMLQTGDATTPSKPYYIEYRLLDLDERTITAEFGALVSSTSSRNRFMSVQVRVGNHKVDSSNFITSEGFSGFLGSTGTVGIDHDYDSLREDLWLATDQAFKEALESYSKKQAFLNRLARAPTIDDFQQEPATVQIDPLQEPDWTSRNWEAEAKTASAALRAFPQIYSSRVTYHLIYATTYLMNTEGTQIRKTTTLAAIEASLESESDDGMPMHDFYTSYAEHPADLPSAQVVHDALTRTGQEMVDLRAAPPVPDYDGPVLFDASATGSLLAQLLGPSLSGARPPLSMLPRFDEMMDQLGGHSAWTGKVGTRVLPTSVTLVDDPTAKQWNGHELIGAYGLDQEGVQGQKVTIVSNGMLRQLLMSRRPGPDFDESNGHGRSTFLSDPKPLISNLFFLSSDEQSAAALRQKFLDACRQNGQAWGLEVRLMDNPTVAINDQDNASDFFATAAGGAATGERLPLLVYRVSLADGHEELVRGARLEGLTLKDLRNLLGIGDDLTLFSFAQNQTAGFSGTALQPFGSSEGGVPSTVISPSLLFDEIEVRGPRSEPERLPLVPPPPLD